MPVNRLPQCVNALENTLPSVNTRFRNTSSSAEILAIFEDVISTPTVFPKILKPISIHHYHVYTHIIPAGGNEVLDPLTSVYSTKKSKLVIKVTEYSKSTAEQTL